MFSLNRRDLLITAGGAAVATLTGRTQAESPQAPPSLAQDMTLLRQALAIHPGALRYMTAADIEDGIDQLERELGATEALDQRYLIFQRFLSQLKCGHTYANFFNQSREVQADLFDRPTRLPFSFRWLNDAMVVTDAAPGVDISPGSIVTDINGISPASMLETLLPYTRADGTALGKRIALLEVQNRSRFEYFDVFHGLVFGAPEGGKHQLQLTTPDGQSRQLSAAPISLEERRAIRASFGSATTRDDPLWQFDVRDDVGILTMPGWAVFNTDWDWSTWLDARLDEASRLRGLIIDNRDNEGGQLDVGAFLLSRLIREAVSLPQYRHLVKFRTFPESLRPHAGTWDKSFYRVGVGAEDVGDGFYELRGNQGWPESLSPRGTPVDVPVTLLTSPTNSSATFTFARVGQETGRMRLIGQETGGNLRGINGNGFFFTTLPYIGIEFDLPMVGTFPMTSQPDGGVKPDIEITETAPDIAAGRDTTLERAIDDIRQ